MRKSRPPVSWSSKRRGQLGLTLIELLVTLAILSILAAAALPYAELTVRRDKELELSRSLREVRSAIDAFHEDWQAGRISQSVSVASADGYPRTLQVLVDGVDSGRAGGGKRRYLRRVPHNPFNETGESPWVLRGYQDDADALSWNGRDVYDLHAATDKLAIDGSNYRDW